MSVHFSVQWFLSGLFSSSTREILSAHTSYVQLKLLNWRDMWEIFQDCKTYTCHQQLDLWFAASVSNLLMCCVWVYVIVHVCVRICLHLCVPNTHKQSQSRRSVWRQTFLRHPATSCKSVDDTNVRFPRQPISASINRIKVNVRWLPWWCCHGDQSKGEVSWWVAVCSDSLLPKMRSRQRAENELRGGLLPEGDCRECVFIAPAPRRELFSLSSAWD